MSKHIGTCGHEIDEGISMSIDEGQIMYDGSSAITYGTYCADCVIDFCFDGRVKILNKDMLKLIEKLTWNIYDS